MAGTVEVVRYTAGARLSESEFGTSAPEVEHVAELLLDTMIPATEDRWETTVVVRRPLGELFVTCTSGEWLVSFMPSGPGDARQVTTADAPAETVELSVGGVTTPVPRAWLVDPDRALAAFRAFAREGRLVAELRA